MAFDLKYLTNADQNFDGPMAWYYNGTTAGSDDAIADINTAGFFNKAANYLSENDLITVMANNGHFLVIVNSNDGSTVDVTDGTQVSATDSD